LLLVLTLEHLSSLLIFGVGLSLLFQKPSLLLVYVLVMAPELCQALLLVVEMHGLPLVGYKISQVYEIPQSQYSYATYFFTEGT
jgi:hypothetical protein